MKKVAVQASLQYKQVETKDSIKKTISGLKQKPKKGLWRPDGRRL